MLLILIITSVVLQVCSAESNSSSFQSAQEISKLTSLNTAEGSKNASQENIIIMPKTSVSFIYKTRIRADVKQNHSLDHHKQDHTSNPLDRQNIEVGGSLGLVPQNSNSFTKNMSHQYRRKRHKHNRISLSKHLHGKQEGKYDNTASREEDLISTEGRGSASKFENGEQSKAEVAEYQNLNSEKDDDVDSDDDNDDKDEDDYGNDTNKDAEGLENDKENSASTYASQIKTENQGSKNRMNFTQEDRRPESTKNGPRSSVDFKNNTYEFKDNVISEVRLEKSTRRGQWNSRGAKNRIGKERGKSLEVKRKEVVTHEKVDQPDDKKQLETNDQIVDNGQKTNCKSRMMLYTKTNNNTIKNGEVASPSFSAGDSKNIGDGNIETELKQTKKFCFRGKHKSGAEAGGDRADLCANIQNKIGSSELKIEDIQSNLQTKEEVNIANSKESVRMNNTDLSLYKQLNEKPLEMNTIKDNTAKKFSNKNNTQCFRMKNETITDNENLMKQVGKGKKMKMDLNKCDNAQISSACKTPSNESKTDIIGAKMANENEEVQHSKIARTNDICGTREKVCERKCTKITTAKTNDLKTVAENVFVLENSGATTAAETLKNERASNKCNKMKLMEELKWVHKKGPILKSSQKITKDGNDSKVTTCEEISTSVNTKSTNFQRNYEEGIKTNDPSSDLPKERELVLFTRINDTCDPDEKMKALKEKIILPLVQESIEKKITELCPSECAKLSKKTKSACKTTTKTVKTTKECFTSGKTTLTKKILNCTTPVTVNPLKTTDYVTQTPRGAPKKTAAACVTVKIGSENTRGIISSYLQNTTELTLDVITLGFENSDSKRANGKTTRSSGNVGSNINLEACQSFTQSAHSPPIKNSTFTSESVVESVSRPSECNCDQNNQTAMDHRNRTETKGKQRHEKMNEQEDEKHFDNAEGSSGKRKPGTRKPFQLYLNMLNSLTKKSEKSRKKKVKITQEQEKLTDPTSIGRDESHDDVALSPAMNHENAFEDSAKRLLQVYVSQINRPTIIPTNVLSSSDIKNQIFEPKHQNIIDYEDLKEDVANEGGRSLFSSTEDTNLFDLLFDPASPKPKKSFPSRLFKQHFFKIKSKKNNEKGKMIRMSERTTGSVFDEIPDAVVEQTNDVIDTNDETFFDDSANVVGKAMAPSKKSEIKELLGALHIDKLTKAHAQSQSDMQETEDDANDENLLRDLNYDVKSDGSEKQSQEDEKMATLFEEPGKLTFPKEKEEVLTQNYEETPSETAERREFNENCKAERERNKKRVSDRFRSLYSRKKSREGIKKERNEHEDLGLPENQTSSKMIRKLIPNFVYKHLHGKEGTAKNYKNKAKTCDKNDTPSGKKTEWKSDDDALRISNDNEKSMKQKRKTFLFRRRKNKASKEGFSEPFNDRTLKAFDPVYGNCINCARINQKKKQSLRRKRRFAELMQSSSKSFGRAKRNEMMNYDHLTPLKKPPEVNYSKEKTQQDGSKLSGREIDGNLMSDRNRFGINGYYGGQPLQEENYLVSTFDKNSLNNCYTWNPNESLEIRQSPKSRSINVQGTLEKYSIPTIGYLERPDRKDNVKQSFNLFVKDISKNLNSLDIIADETKRDSSNRMKKVTFSLVQNLGKETVPIDIAHVFFSPKYNTVADRESDKITKIISEIVTVPILEQENKTLLKHKFPEIYHCSSKFSSVPTATMERKGILSNDRVDTNSEDEESLGLKRTSNSLLDIAKLGKEKSQTSDHWYSNVALMKSKQNKIFSIHVPNITSKEKFCHKKRSFDEYRNELITSDLKNPKTNSEGFEPSKIFIELTTREMQNNSMAQSTTSALSRSHDANFNLTDYIFEVNEKPSENSTVLSARIIKNIEDLENVTEKNDKYFPKIIFPESINASLKNLQAVNVDWKMENPIFLASYYKNNALQDFETLKKMKVPKVVALQSDFRCGKEEIGINNIDENGKNNISTYKDKSLTKLFPATDISCTAMDNVQNRFELRTIAIPFNQKIKVPIDPKTNSMIEPPSTLPYVESKLVPKWTLLEHRLKNHNHAFEGTFSKKYGMFEQVSPHVIYYPVIKPNEYMKVDNENEFLLHNASYSLTGVSAMVTSNAPFRFEVNPTNFVHLSENDFLDQTLQAKARRIKHGDPSINVEISEPKISSLDNPRDERLSEASNQVPEIVSSNYNQRKMYVFEITTKVNVSGTRESATDVNEPIIPSNVAFRWPLRNTPDSGHKKTTLIQSTVKPGKVDGETSIVTTFVETTPSTKNPAMNNSAMTTPTVKISAVKTPHGSSFSIMSFNGTLRGKGNVTHDQISTLMTTKCINTTVTTSCLPFILSAPSNDETLTTIHNQTSLTTSYVPTTVQTSSRGHTLTTVRNQTFDTTNCLPTSIYSSSNDQTAVTTFCLSAAVHTSVSDQILTTAHNQTSLTTSCLPAIIQTSSSDQTLKNVQNQASLAHPERPYSPQKTVHTPSDLHSIQTTTQIPTDIHGILTTSQITQTNFWDPETAQSLQPCTNNTTDNSCEKSCLVNVLGDHINLTSSAVSTEKQAISSKTFRSRLTTIQEQITTLSSDDVLTKTAGKLGAGKSLMNYDLLDITENEIAWNTSSDDAEIKETQNFKDTKKFRSAGLSATTERGQIKISDDFAVNFPSTNCSTNESEESDTLAQKHQGTLHFKDDILAVNDNQINDFSITAEKWWVPDSRRLEESPITGFQSYVSHFETEFPTGEVDHQRQKNALKNDFQKPLPNFYTIHLTKTPHTNQVDVKRNHVIPRPVQFLCDNPKNTYPVLLNMPERDTPKYTEIQTKILPLQSYGSTVEKTRVPFGDTYPNGVFSTQSENLLPLKNKISENFMVTKSVTLLMGDPRDGLHGASSVKSQRVISSHLPTNSFDLRPLDLTYGADYKNTSRSVKENRKVSLLKNIHRGLDDQGTASRPINFLDEIRQPENKKFNTMAISEKENPRESIIFEGSYTKSHPKESLGVFKNYSPVTINKNRQILYPKTGAKNLQGVSKANGRFIADHDEKNSNQAGRRMDNYTINNDQEIAKDKALQRNYDVNDAKDLKDEDNHFKMTSEVGKIDSSNEIYFPKQSASDLFSRTDVCKKCLRHKLENPVKETDGEFLSDKKDIEQSRGTGFDTSMTSNDYADYDNFDKEKKQRERILKKGSEEKGRRINLSADKLSYSEGYDRLRNRNDVGRISEAELRSHERKVMTDRMLKQNSHIGKQMTFDVDSKKKRLDKIQNGGRKLSFPQNRRVTEYYSTKAALHRRKLNYDGNDQKYLISNETLFNDFGQMMRKGKLSDISYDIESHGESQNFENKKQQSLKQSSRYSNWSTDQTVISYPEIIQHDENILNPESNRSFSKFENNPEIKSYTKKNRDSEFIKTLNRSYQTKKNIIFPSSTADTVKNVRTYKWNDEQRFAPKTKGRPNLDRKQWSLEQRGIKKDHPFVQPNGIRETETKDEELADDYEETMNTASEFYKTPFTTLSTPDMNAGDSLSTSFNYALDFTTATEKPKSALSEDMLNGKLAIRLVGNVLSEVEKSKQLSTEFGLCKNNLTKIKEEILPPQTPAEAKIQADFVTEIVNVVNAYLSKQPKAACMILPPEMKTFLNWLIDDEPLQPPRSSLIARKTSKKAHYRDFESNAYEKNRKFSKEVCKKDQPETSDDADVHCLTSRAKSSTNPQKNQIKRQRNGKKEDGEIRIKNIYDTKFKSRARRREKKDRWRLTAGVVSTRKSTLHLMKNKLNSHLISTSKADYDKSQEALLHAS